MQVVKKHLEQINEISRSPEVRVCFLYVFVVVATCLISLEICVFLSILLCIVVCFLLLNACLYFTLHSSYYSLFLFFQPFALYLHTEQSPWQYCCCRIVTMLMKMMMMMMMKMLCSCFLTST